MNETKTIEYGIYQIIDYLELKIHNVEIKIEKVSDNAFTYIRKDTENNIVEKIIPVKENKLLLEIAPIRPLNYPARRTNHVFLNFDKEIFLSEGSAATVFVQCPIEIGIFLVHGSHKDSLDWFTCDPLISRFGLFGSPDSGRLCKFFNAHIVESFDSSQPFLNAVMQITFENQLDTGHSISKIVFPITDHTLHYNGTKSVIDNLKIVLKKRGLVKYGDITSVQFSNPDWNNSPMWETGTSTGAMEMGLE